MMLEKLLEAIEEAKQNRQTTLDLGGKGIEELPSEIGQLTNLTSLDLSYNRVTTLPDAIGQLSNLTSFDLNNNRLRICRRRSDS
jgi:internalin A